jgi:vacuolar-type H+-ATPase subunit I/STV1
LYIKTFGEDTADIDINLFGDFKWGDKFSVSKVSYEDGTQNYKFGDETASTVYINQNNMYIVDSEQIENIYNQIKDFEVYSFEGETIIDPAYDIGDILIIDGKKVIYQGELEYAGKFKANIKSKIQAKTEQESMQTKSNSSEKIRRVQSEINQINGEVTQLVNETTEHEEKITQVKQDIDSIKQKVADTVDYKRDVEGITEIHLENAKEINILNLIIEGNKKYECNLYPDEDLYPSSDLNVNQEVM